MVAASTSVQSFLSPKTSFNHRSSSAPAFVRFRPTRVTCTYTATPSPTMASISSSLYEILGIPMGASCDEIKTAYRRLARVCHPDVVAINAKDTSADKFMKIHAAYSTLSDPQKRADYDRALFRKKSPYNSPFSTSSASSAMGSYSRRNWETDQCW
ncbi:hypothetical protein GIB67_002971 [Kingdonia uniflora]|uniref:J domain-containing protein n=1 Tax=Kingdonia uniflora TaxID=39325 RepID=A0A7J7MDB8_9MAGN|nr:hypothetical protein GIB67_002971 [Kingdonia uniflora]